MIVCQRLLGSLLPCAEIGIFWQLPGFCTRNITVVIQHTPSRDAQPRPTVSLTKAEITSDHWLNGREELATSRAAGSKYPPLATSRIVGRTTIACRPAHKDRRQGSSLTCAQARLRRIRLGGYTGVSSGRAVDRAPTIPQRLGGSAPVSVRRAYSRHTFPAADARHRNPSPTPRRQVGRLSFGEAVTPPCHYLRGVAARLRHAVCCRRHSTGVHLGVANISLSEADRGGSLKSSSAATSTRN